MEYARIGMDPDKPIHAVSRHSSKVAPVENGVPANDKPRQGPQPPQEPRQTKKSRPATTPPILVFVCGLIAGVALVVVLNFLLPHSHQQLPLIKETPTVEIPKERIPSQLLPAKNENQPAKMSSAEQTYVNIDLTPIRRGTALPPDTPVDPSIASLPSSPMVFRYAQQPQTLCYDLPDTPPARPCWPYRLPLRAAWVSGLCQRHASPCP